MYQKLLWIVAFSLSLLLGQTAFAHGKGPEGMGAMIESLNLDDAQKAKVKPILNQLKSSIKKSVTQMSGLHTQINQQVQSDAMNPEIISGLIDKKIKLIGDIMKAKVTADHQIFILLNPQQRAAYKKWDENMSRQFQKLHHEE